MTIASFSERGTSIWGQAIPDMNKRILARGPDAEKRFRIRVLIDVVWGPSVETGANVPGYSGGLAASMGSGPGRWVMIERDQRLAWMEGADFSEAGCKNRRLVPACVRSFLALTGP